MKLTRNIQVKITGSLKNLLSKARTGDQIVLVNGEKEGWSDWWPHPKGVVVKRRNRLLLNGKKLLFEGNWDEIKPHPKGVAVKIGNQILLNGKKPISEEYPDFYICPKGTVSAKRRSILLNNKKLLYHGKWNNWSPHPKGAVIFLESKVFVNKKLVYEGFRIRLFVHQEGVVIEKERRLLLIVAK